MIRWKKAGAAAICIVIGFVMSSIIHRIDGAASKNLPGSPTGSGPDTHPSRADLERQIAALRTELAAATRNTAQAADSDSTASRPRTPTEFRDFMDRRYEELRAEGKRREIAQLLAAGFTKERIEWLLGRADELQAKRRQAENERHQKGLPPDTNEVMKYYYDYDYDLRYEIGDPEYARYREALGRPPGIKILEVLHGSYAESNGLKPGDVVVGYAGKRVFNAPEMETLISKVKVGESATLEVRRGEQTLLVVVPRGPLGIRSPGPIRGLPDLPGLPSPKEQN